MRMFSNIMTTMMIWKLRELNILKEAGSISSDLNGYEY